MRQISKLTLKQQKQILLGAYTRLVNKQSFNTIEDLLKAETRKFMLQPKMVFKQKPSNYTSLFKHVTKSENAKPFTQDLYVFYWSTAVAESNRSIAIYIIGALALTLLGIFLF